MERDIVFDMFSFIKKEKYTPTAEELHCQSLYRNSAILWGIGTFAFWTSLAVYTADLKNKRNIPKWVKWYGFFTIPFAVLGTLWVGSTFSAEHCVHCHLNVKNKQTELYALVRQLAKEKKPSLLN
jgi:hypothetical protein